jgi:hypothetical protein
MHATKMFALGEVKAVEDADGDPNGEFDVILSAPTLDRDGEVVDAKIFDPLPDHITFDIDHGMSTATTVGSGTPFYDGDKLRVKGTYSSIPRAQEVRTLVREGHIRTTSVAFMGAVREEKDGVPHVVKAELLNGAFVPIPSNRESVVLSAKSYEAAIKAGARNSSKDIERLQSIHDFAVENGAACEPPAEPEKAVSSGVTRKAHGMSANTLREALDAVLREAYGGEDTYVWVRDYDDAWVVFEISQPDEYTLYRETYSVTDGAVTLAGDRAEVVARTTYEPATSAPETPSDEDGKSPASNVVEMARIRADIARLSLD